mgnify:CR=1 FL=1
MRSDSRRSAAHAERAAVLETIARLEAAGGESFFTDVEQDPPGHPLAPEEVDYLQARPANRIRSFFARRLADLALAWFGRDLRIRLEGEENLRDLPRNGGAIITSNHFSKTESLCVLKAAKKVPGRHRLWRVIKGNNVFIPGAIGFLMRHCDTLPLSTNLRTQRLFSNCLREILATGGLVLIYPEQAMWWNYRRPRPHKPGAYFYAAKNGVPILPLFVTLADQPGRYDRAGYPKQAYTVHILPPIYPDPDKTLRENAHAMQAQNERLCREVYETVYGEALPQG